ncbi:MAG TPA: hypothetical protein VNE71_04905 [Myxococcota bacterium]|nr:hypothetical protein [Myxococcota bacterium]
MVGIRVRLAAGLVALALAAPAAAECPASSTYYAPAYNGPLKTYGLAMLLVDPLDGKKSVTAKTSKQCADCETPTRGVQLASKRELGGGYVQFPFDVGATFCAAAHVDVSRVIGPGAFASLEFDSPAVAIEESPLSYVFVAVQDDGGVRTVWAEVSDVPAGTPFELPADTQQVRIELEYAGGQVDVRVRPEGGELTPIATDVAFPFGGSGRLGIGAYDLARGDRAGIDVSASGEIFTAAFRDLLDGLLAEEGRMDAAAAALANEDTAGARTQIVDAISALDPGLVGAVGALPESKVKTFAAAQLGKALAKLTQARDAIDAATPTSVASAAGAVGKAVLAFHRAERALRNGSVAEASIPPAG